MLRDVAVLMLETATTEKDLLLQATAEWIADVAYAREFSDVGSLPREEEYDAALHIAMVWQHQRLTGGPADGVSSADSIVLLPGRKVRGLHIIEPEVAEGTHGLRTPDADDGPREVSGETPPSPREQYLNSFSLAWWSVATASEPMPTGWRKHVSMLFDNGVSERDLREHVHTVCSGAYDQIWCCQDCAFHRVVELCCTNLGDHSKFGLEKWEGRA